MPLLDLARFQRGAPMPQNGRPSNAHAATLEMVIKGVRRGRPFLPGVEFVCMSLARMLMPPSVRVPPCLLHDSTFGSVRINTTGAPLDVLRKDPEAIAAIVGFDTWILNIDRAPFNLGSTRDGLVWLWDHCCSLSADGTASPDGIMAWIDGVSPSGASPRQGTSQGGSCVAALADDPLALLRWADTIAALPDGHVAGVVALAQAHDALDGPTAEAFTAFLLHRKRKLRELLRRAHRCGQLPKIETWPT